MLLTLPRLSCWFCARHFAREKVRENIEAGRLAKGFDAAMVS
jgi:hypothetical protein